jgi:small subunit ribosomal protein S14
MKSSVIRDRRIRSTVSKYEIRRRTLKFCQRHGLLDAEDVRVRLAELPRDSSATRVKRYCVHTGRGRGVLRDFKRSRRHFREEVKYGRLPGVNKSTW